MIHKISSTSNANALRGRVVRFIEGVGQYELGCNVRNASGEDTYIPFPNYGIYSSDVVSNTVTVLDKSSGRLLMSFSEILEEELRAILEISTVKGNTKYTTLTAKGILPKPETVSLFKKKQSEKKRITEPKVVLEVIGVKKDEDWKTKTDVYDKLTQLNLPIPQELLDSLDIYEWEEPDRDPPEIEEDLSEPKYRFSAYDTIGLPECDGQTIYLDLECLPKDMKKLKIKCRIV